MWIEYDWLGNKNNSVEEMVVNDYRKLSKPLSENPRKTN